MKRARGPLAVFGLSVACLSVAFLDGILVPVDVDVGWAFRGFIVLISVPYVVLGAVVTETLQPAHVSRWLRSEVS